MEKQNGNVIERLSRFREIVGIASGLSIIFGVAISITQLVQFVDNSKRANVSLRLSSLDKVKQFLERDEEIRRLAQRFLTTQLPAMVGKKDSLIEKYGSGEALYLSKEMEDFAAVHYHYEQMGALVKLEYVEFRLIFEIVAFPDVYMNSTEEVRSVIRENWNGRGKALPDLGANIEYLKKCYQKSRLNYSKVPSCPSP